MHFDSVHLCVVERDRFVQHLGVPRRHLLHWLGLLRDPWWPEEMPVESPCDVRRSALRWRRLLLCGRESVLPKWSAPLRTRWSDDHVHGAYGRADCSANDGHSDDASADDGGAVHGRADRTDDGRADDSCSDNCFTDGLWL